MRPDQPLGPTSGEHATIVNVTSQGDASTHRTNGGSETMHVEQVTTTRTIPAPTSPMVKGVVGVLISIGLLGGGTYMGRQSGAESSDQTVRIEYLERDAKTCKERLKALEDERTAAAVFVQATNDKITTLQRSVDRIENLLSAAASSQRKGTR